MTTSTAIAEQPTVRTQASDDRGLGRGIVLALTASLIVVVLALLMLQPVKGGVIALQWAGRMGDFA